MRKLNFQAIEELSHKLQLEINWLSDIIIGVYVSFNTHFSHHTLLRSCTSSTLSNQGLVISVTPGLFTWPFETNPIEKQLNEPKEMFKDYLWIHACNGIENHNKENNRSFTYKGALRIYLLSYKPMIWSATAHIMAWPGGILMSRGSSPFHKARSPSSA